MGFRSLRVLNEDHIAAGRGFPTHPHRDMEIFSYIVSGALAHRDSMGNSETLRPGQIQLMSAGSGVTHSEANPDKDNAVHLLQIWIEPASRGLEPTYSEWHPDAQREQDAKVLVISPDGEDGSAVIHQDAKVYRLRLEPGQTVSHELGNDRGLWLQVIRGKLDIGGTEFEAGDGASSEQPGVHQFRATETVEALLIDLP